MEKKIFFTCYFFFLIISKGISQQAILPAGGNGTGSGGSFSYSIGQIDYVTFSSATGNVELGVQHADPKFIVNLKLFLEGYYNANNNAMLPVNFNQGISTSTNNVDDITVELRNASNGSLVATNTVKLQTDGTATINYPTTISGNFYIAIKHRNTIQTWSATAQTVGPTPLTYDFTTAANKAFDSNMIAVEPGVYVLYTGDINQDGIIDPLDYSSWETDSNDFAFGNYVTDLNGDGIVDPIDYTIWEVNANNFIFSSSPFFSNKHKFKNIPQ